jgi:hypothetical protein
MPKSYDGEETEERRERRFELRPRITRAGTPTACRHTDPVTLDPCHPCIVALITSVSSVASVFVFDMRKHAWTCVDTHSASVTTHRSLLRSASSVKSVAQSHYPCNPWPTPPRAPRSLRLIRLCGLASSAAPGLRTEPAAPQPAPRREDGNAAVRARALVLLRRPIRCAGACPD